MKSKISLSAPVKINDNISLKLTSCVDVTEEELAGSLRDMVKMNCDVGDDAGCDWYYDVKSNLIFIGGSPEWIASENPKYIQFMVAADLLDGMDYTASGNGIEIEN